MFTWIRLGRRLRLPLATPAVARHLTALAYNSRASAPEIDNAISSSHKSKGAGPSTSRVPSVLRLTDVRSLTEDDLVALLQRESQAFHNQSGLKLESSGRLSSKSACRPFIGEGFLELCRRGSRRLEELTPDDVKALVVSAERSQTNKLLNKLTAQYTKYLDANPFSGVLVKDHFQAIESILQHVLVEGSASPKHCVKLFQVLLKLGERHEFTPSFSPKSFAALTKLMYSRPERWFDQNAEAVESFIRYVRVVRLQPIEVPRRGDAFSSDVNVWWELFVFVKILLDRGSHRSALSLIHALLEHDVIPVHAIDSTIATSHFREFGVAVLIRTCVHYRWADGVARLLCSESMSDELLLEHHTVLVNDVISDLTVDDPRALEECSRIIRHTWAANGRILIRNEHLHAFLKACRRTGATKAAELLLHVLYQAANRESSSFKPLGRSYVAWLLDHLVNGSKNRNIAQLFIEDIVKAKHQLDIRIRGTIIALCAAGGFRSEVRELWNAYACSFEGDTAVVVGHARCMLAVVKLFGTDDEGSGGGGIRESDESGDLPKQALILESFSKADSGIALRPQRENKEQLSGNFIAGVIDGQEDTRASAGNHIELEHSHGSAVALNGVQHDNQSNYDFALRVLSAFREAKEPLSAASHYDLNAYARASAILGLFRQSMRAFQALLQRREVPDQYDLHVTLSVMTDDDPQRASRLLVGLVEEGIRADAAVCSAVTLGSIRRGERRLAVATYEKLRQLGKPIGALTPEGSAELALVYLDLLGEIKAGESHPFRGWARQRAHELATQVFAPEAPVAGDLRSRILYKAVDADPQFAFQLWKLYPRRGQLANENHKRMRHAISEGLCKAISEGHLDEQSGSRMIEDLDHDTEIKRR